MDLITGLIGLTLAIVFAIVIYFIIVSSTKEKSYDEVKAEQKKRAEEYFAQGRSAKEKAKDKKLKKAGKKVKEKSSVESIEVSSDEVDTVKGHVVFAEPPAIVDEKPPMIEEKKKKKNKKKEKPILLNKNEITPVVDISPPIVNHFEQIMPKDDFALKRSVSRENDLEKATEPQPTVQKQPSNKQGKAPTIPSKEPKAEKPQSQKPVVVEKLVAPVKQSVKVQEKQLPQVQQKPVDEVLAKTAVKPIQTAAPLATVDNASPSMKSSRKKRSEFATLQQMSGEKDAVNVSALMPLVHKAELSRTEIQVLIDVLLNKQQGSSEDSAEWIEGRQDPVVKLKKQLAEKEKALVEEQEAAAALQSKLRELRSELNSERHSSRQLEENLTLSKQELAGLGSRIQHLAEEKQGLVQQIQQLQAKLTEEHMLLCKVKEETQNVMQQELLAQRQQLEVHIARLTEQHQETIATLEAQMGQMAAQLQEQENVNSTLSGELTLLRERGVHLQDSAAQSQDLARQIKELHNEMERMRSKSQYEVSSLTEQLNLKRAEVDKLSSITQSLQTENSRLTHQVSSASVEAQQLRDENETLAAQVTASMERPATEGRENGDVAYSENKHIDNGSDKVHEKELIAEKLKDDIALKEKELSHFKTDVAQKEVLMTSLKGELDAARANTEKMAKEISSYKCLVQEQESAIKTLREDGESAHKTVSSLREEITRLSKDCATMGQLASRESAIEKLTSELNTHKTRLADQAALILTLQRETEKLKTDAEDSSRGERERLTSELNRCKTDLAERESAMKALTAQSEAHQATVVKLQSELDASKQELGKLVREAADATDKLASLTEELVAQKRKNDDLRSKNWKAMDALSTTEKTLETKLKESQRLVSETEKTARQEEQERTKQLLQRLLPHVSVDSKQDYEQWLKQLTANVQEKGQGDEGGERHATMLAELERQNCQLQAMVTHYKAIIADTEGMLNRLQSHVEQEEGRWGQQIQALQTQLEAVMQERDRLQSGIRNGPHMVDDGSDTN